MTAPALLALAADDGVHAGVGWVCLDTADEMCAATITGEPADLIRLSDALRQAALRAIDAKVAAAREVAS